MPVPGLAAAGSALSGIGTACSHAMTPQVTEFDSAALLSGTFFATRANNVGQTFDRRLYAIDNKVERQKLHREDIRDLIELTGKRMDIYHLVGTLLLTFAMVWYSDSNAWELPVWFSDVFLISNFATVGFLIMCVWLAMYAAVASRSIGTRLLTSVMRLALPTGEQLDRIRNPIFFNARDAFRSRCCRSASNPDIAGSSGYDSCRSAPVEVPSEDDHQHFRVFLEELPRWLAHDTWSRVCMSIGMNQMLQAMSYFSLATIWPRSPMAGIMSYASINILAFFVLWIDIGETQYHVLHYLAISTLAILPAVLAISLLIWQSMWPDVGDGPRYVEAVMVLFCFWAHAGWLAYVVSLFSTAGRQDGTFQPGIFANVLEWIPKDRQHHQAKEDPFLGHTNSEEKAEPATESGPMDSARRSMNGGKAPGIWTTSSETQAQTKNHDLHSTDWLPVRMVKYFTRVTILWWILAGLAHSLLIEFDKNNTFKDFTGSNNMIPLKTKLLQLSPLKAQPLQFPPPARLFKVEALHCSDSQVWVSNSFSFFAMVQDNNLELVKDGRVKALICGTHGCDTLSPPLVDGGLWTLASLNLSSVPSMQVPIPGSWRRVTGIWINCPKSTNATCISARIAGWDGQKIIAAALQRDMPADTWAVHPRFEVDPGVGLCTDDHADCKVKESSRYNDVKALQVGSGGRTLVVLLADGALDIWDLYEGVVLKRMQLGDSYTSMCQRGEDIFLSREGSRGPTVSTMVAPSELRELMHHGQTNEQPVADSGNLQNHSAVLGAQVVKSNLRQRLKV